MYIYECVYIYHHISIQYVSNVIVLSPSPARATPSPPAGGVESLDRRYQNRSVAKGPRLPQLWRCLKKWWFHGDLMGFSW